MSFKSRIFLGFFIIILITIVLAVSLNQFLKLQYDSLIKNYPQQNISAITDISFTVLQVKQVLIDVAVTHNQKNYLAAEDAARNFKKIISQLRETKSISQNEIQKLDSLNQFRYVLRKRSPYVIYLHF